MLSSVRRAEGELNTKMPGRFTAFGDLPHLAIGRLDVPAEAVGVEQGMGSAVLRQSVPKTA